MNYQDKYSDDYKHFDNLIWQVPLWSTGIFLLAVTAVAYISNMNVETIAPNLDAGLFSKIVLGVCFIFQISIFNALIRFRKHQKQVTNEDVRVFAHWFRSGQTWLQISVICQTAALGYLLMQFADIFHEYQFTLSVILIGACMFYSYYIHHKTERST